MNSSQTRTRVLILSAIGILLIYFGLKLYRAPLESYTWTELLINYAAGFIRRGLVGRIAYYFSQFISPIFFLTLSVIAGYLTQLVLFFASTRNVPTREWLLFTLSPTAFLFVIYNFDAYGRKDVYLLVISLLSTYLILKRVRLAIAFPVILALYEIGALIHEYALFYFPLILILLLILESDRPAYVRYGLVGGGFVWMAANYLWLFGLSSQHYNLEAIAESWVGLIPNYDLTIQDGAMGWLGIPLKDGLQPVFDKLTYPQTFFSYAAAGALSLIPIALLNRRFAIISECWRRIEKDLTSQLLIVSLAISSLAISIVSSDWGRLIYLYAMTLFPMMDVLIKRLALNDRAPVEVRNESDPYERLTFALLLIVFAATWMVKMYVDGGHIALQNGALFRLLDWVEHLP